MKYSRSMALIACVVFACASAALIYWRVSAAHAPARIDQDDYYPVSYVIDGDTFKARIGAKTITVRVLGIDTPETVDPRKPVQCYGKEASDEAKSLLVGRKVELKLNPNRELTDKYGRYLAYVYRDDGLFYNEYMLQNGYAREYTFSTSVPYSFQAQFKGDEAVAEAAGKGLWGKCEDAISSS